MTRFRKLLPSQEEIRRNRWLRWLGPALLRGGIWHVSRRPLALGVALGIFFGLLIPIAQIPVSAAAAVAMRANLPAAVASTLVTNPLTFGPVYYAAWRLGGFVLGDTRAPTATPPVAAQDASPWSGMVRRVLGVGKPLLVGLAIMATAVGLLTYYAVYWAWTARVLWKRRARRRRADAGSPFGAHRQG